jgi:hypothetical protein
LGNTCSHITRQPGLPAAMEDSTMPLLPHTVEMDFAAGDAGAVEAVAREKIGLKILDAEQGRGRLSRLWPEEVERRVQGRSRVFLGNNVHFSPISSRGDRIRDYASSRSS